MGLTEAEQVDGDPTRTLPPGVGDGAAVAGAGGVPATLRTVRA